MAPLAILAALAPIVPSIAKMMGMSDNATKVADVAVDVLQKVTGVSETEKAIEVLKANPDLLLQYQTAILAKETAMEQAFVSDKASARNRDMEYVKLGRPNVRANFLVAFVAALLLFILYLTVFTELNEYAKGALTTIGGFALAQLTNVFQFEFGTTRKEEDNNREIFKDWMKTP